MLLLGLELITLGTLSLYYYAHINDFRFRNHGKYYRTEYKSRHYVHVNKANWESLVYNNYCRMVRNCVHDAEGLIA